MSTSVSSTAPRTAAPTILATLPLPPVPGSTASGVSATGALAAPIPEDPRIVLIRKANAEATEIAQSLANRLKAGEQGGDAGRALKIELAKARLKALRLAAIVAAGGHDGKRALGIAKEVADVARELKAMAGTQTSDPEIAAATTSDTTPAATQTETATPTATASPATTAATSPDDAEINGLLAHARATLTILRKAAKPGSEEERRIAGMLAGVGTPSLESDLTASADAAHIDLSV